MCSVCMCVHEAYDVHTASLPTSDRLLQMTSKHLAFEDDRPALLAQARDSGSSRPREQPLGPALPLITCVTSPCLYPHLHSSPFSPLEPDTSHFTPHPSPLTLALTPRTSNLGLTSEFLLAREQYATLAPSALRALRELDLGEFVNVARDERR